MKSSIAPTQICPNLQTYWQLGHLKNSHQWVLKTGDRQHPLTPQAAYILQHFVGSFTVAQIQAECDRHFGADTSPTLVIDTIQDLTDQGF